MLFHQSPIEKCRIFEKRPKSILMNRVIAEEAASEQKRANRMIYLIWTTCSHGHCFTNSRSSIDVRKFLPSGITPRVGRIKKINNNPKYLINIVSRSLVYQFRADVHSSFVSKWTASGNNEENGSLVAQQMVRSPSPDD